jgi:hypothetical protein
MTVRSRVKGFKYYCRRKLCDVLIHGDHLSVYIRNLTAADDNTGWPWRHRQVRAYPGPHS